MVMRIIAGCGLAIALLTALSACAPPYYSDYPAYHARSAYPPANQRAPNQSPTPAQPRGSDWVNPEPAR
jgi:hypothetical protein